MPKMGDAIEEGTLLQWLKQDGEPVKTGDVIAQIETDKCYVEIEAEDAGVLHIQAQPGTVVPVGKVIAVIGDGAANSVVVSRQPAPLPAAQPEQKMEMLKLLKELESLIENQKTLLGMTYNFRQDDFLSMTNKIRMAIPNLLPRQVMEKTEQVLMRHIQSQEEVAAIMNEIRTAALS